MDFATGGDLAGHIEKRAKTGEHYSEEVTHATSSAQTVCLTFVFRLPVNSVPVCCKQLGSCMKTTYCSKPHHQMRFSQFH